MAKRTIPHAFKIVAAAAIVLFLLTWWVSGPSKLVDLDQSIAAAVLAEAGSTWWRVLIWITSVGGSPATVPVMFVITILLLREERQGLIAWQWSGYLGARLITAFMKASVGRQRPEMTDVLRQVAGATDASFPSGHSTSAIYVYGFLLLLVWHSRLSRSVAGPLILVLATLIALIAYSRMALGVHYASDVLGGLLVGGLMLALVAPKVRELA